MADEIKPEGNNPQPPAGGKGEVPPASNQNSADNSQQKIKELEAQLKEQSSKNAELSTTLATIQAREREIQVQKLKENADADTQARLKRITESISIDPDTASAELAHLLEETRKRAAEEAAERVRQETRGQSFVEKLKGDIKTANPDFDDDLVQDVLDKANVYAQSGKYKTPDECVKAASEYVKSKLENYATKKNASPVVPEGGRAEAGGNNAPPPPPPPEKEVSPLEELNQANEAKSKRLHIRG